MPELESNALEVSGPSDAILAVGGRRDETVVGMWLHGRSKNTQRAYKRDVDNFLEYAQTDIRSVTLELLQAWVDCPSMMSVASTSRARAIAAVKSLFEFAHRLGYIPFDVGAALKTPKTKDALAERILSEVEVKKLLRAGDTPRNTLMLKLLYAAGIRVSELCGLTWADCTPREAGQGQICVFGKGSKTRYVVIPKSVWSLLEAIKPAEVDPKSPVFASRQVRSSRKTSSKGDRRLAPSSVWRVVKAAAKRAGVALGASPHWFRHANASHALQNGATIALVRDTLGHGSAATTSKYLHARPGESSSKYLKV